jgi:hypothetical protein
MIAKGEPKECTFSMFFVLLVMPYVNISIGVYLNSLSAFLVVMVVSIVYFAIFVNGNAYYG